MSVQQFRLKTWPTVFISAVVAGFLTGALVERAGVVMAHDWLSHVEQFAIFRILGIRLTNELDATFLGWGTDWWVKASPDMAIAGLLCASFTALAVTITWHLRRDFLMDIRTVYVVEVRNVIV